MSEMRGVVEAISTKEVKTKFGLKPTYSMKVGGSWIKCGFKDPKVDSGDEVTCDATSGAYGLETKVVSILAKGSGPVVASSSPVPTPARTPYGRADKVFPIPPLHGDRSIVRQNALARATELFIGARGGKPFDYDDDVAKVIVRLARKFEAYTAGDSDLEEATKEVAEKRAVLNKDKE